MGARTAATSTRCSSGPTGSTAPTTPRRRPAGDVTWAPISRRPHQRLHRRRPERRSRLPHLRGRRGRRRRRRVRRHRRRPGSRSARTRSTSDNPTWTRVGASVLPNRPVDQIAVDRSNWRIAYARTAGSTPPRRATPVTSSPPPTAARRGGTSPATCPTSRSTRVVIDPSDSNTLYVGTDVGTFVTTNGGKRLQAPRHRHAEGRGLAARLRRHQRRAAAGTHGRGAYTLQNRDAAAALVVSKTDSGKPVGPGSTIDYTITVQEHRQRRGDAVSHHRPDPANTTFVSADNGGVASRRERQAGPA